MAAAAACTLAEAAVAPGIAADSVDMAVAVLRRVTVDAATRKLDAWVAKVGAGFDLGAESVVDRGTASGRKAVGGLTVLMTVEEGH